jgi:hypothetical protein
LGNNYEPAEMIFFPPIAALPGVQILIRLSIAKKNSSG